MSWSTGIFEFVRNIIGFLLTLVRMVGIGLALIMLAWMSISYFTADGRGMPWANEKKADIKSNQLKNFAIGLAILLGITSILKFVINIILGIIFD